MNTLLLLTKPRSARSRTVSSIWTIVLLTAMSLSSCRIPFVSTTPTTTSEVDLAHKATVTATLVDSGFAVIDDGSPLPPKVIAQQPTGGQEMALEGEIVLTFDQEMDPQTTSSALQITNPEGTPIAGEISWSDPQTLHFQPNEKLQSGSIYLAKLDTGARSAYRVNISEEIRFQFITAGDLQVSQVFPLDSSRDIAANAMITVIFNRPVVPLVISEEGESLPEPLEISPPTPGKGEWVSTSVYTFQPDNSLQGGTKYSVTVGAGLQDAAKESNLAQDYTWQFSTVLPAIQDFETSSGHVNPENGFENVLLDETFKIRFLQPMDQASTEAVLSLTNNQSEKAPLLFSWDEGFTQILITPTQHLELGKNYNLQLSEQAQAINGGSLSEGLNWNFATIPPPAILKTNPSDGSSQTSFTQEFFINFASPMRIDTVKERIVITPQPERKIEWWYNEWNWSIGSFILEPSTNYEVRFLAGMEDIYGNQIQEEKTIRFATAAYWPSANLLMPYETPILRANGPSGSQDFYINYRNVKNINIELHSLTLDQFLDFLNGRSRSYEYRPSQDSLIWKTEENSQAALNERVIKSLRPITTEGQALPPGIYFLGLDSPQVQNSQPFDDYRLLIVTNANLTFKSSTTDGLVWLTDLESGEPLQGVSIKIYDTSSNIIAMGSTDPDGLLHLDLPAPDDSYSSRFALGDDGEVFSFASSQWGSGVSMWDYGIWSGYYAPANQPTAYIYTERPIYRPGQPVFFKGIVRLDNDLDYSTPDESFVTVKITNIQETVFEKDFSLNQMGSFDGKITLDQGAALGAYTVEVFLPGKSAAIGAVIFNVAEYRRPEFQVQVNTEPENVLAGEDFSIQVQAEYYSGGGVSEAEVAWSLISEPFNFVAPDEYAGYSFSDIEERMFLSEEEQETGSEVVAEGIGITDSNGRFNLSLPVDMSEYQDSRQLTLEATVTDLAQSAVSGRDSLIAHHSSVYPGVKPATYVGTVNEDSDYDVILLDWDGNPLAGQKMNVEIVERRWYSVQEQDAEGRIKWTSTVEEIPVASFRDLIADQDGRAIVSFLPPVGGIYRAKVSARDTNGNLGQASAYMWVAGEDYIPWRQTNDRSFDLVTDKRNYQPGESAEILIASPFQGQAYAMISVERGRIRRQEVILLTNNSTIYSLPISADLAPNTYISVMIVKGVDDSNPRPNFKMGIVEIGVDRLQQTLDVEIEANPSTAGPGDQVQYILRTRDYHDQPISAEVSLSLSDLATLSLMPPNSATILDHFYSNRTLGVWTSVPIVLSIDDYNAAIKEHLVEGSGMGSGGGKGSGDFGVIEVRQDFPDTAFWEAYIRTNQNGEATVTVTLPDNLTTWRMDARAIGGDTIVGQSTLDLISTKPLLVRPQTPRFFVVNDHVSLGSAVHNNTDKTLQVEVKLDARGLTLLNKAAQTVEIPAKNRAYVTWNVAVNQDADRVDLVFSAEGEGLKDASRPPLATLDQGGIPVYRFEALETVGTSGMLSTSETIIESISLPSSMNISSGDLSIKVSPSLAAGMTDGLTYLEHYPYECVEQTISRFLPNVISTRALRAAQLGNSELEANLQEEVTTALQRLYNWQNPNGGWGWWSDQKSDPLTSAYVLLGLIEAKEAGYTVSDAVIERGTNYLRAQIKSILGLTDPSLVNRQAFILYVLARAGEPNVSSSVQLYDQRQRMALYARAFLAQTFYEIDRNDPRLDTLLSDFNSAAILSATGSHWEEQEPDRENWNTDTRTTAIILSTLSHIDPENQLNANAVRWLMSHRSNGHWQSTQETAWSLMALTNWMVASGELDANYQFAVGLNGERLSGGIADRETLRQSLELSVSVTELLTDQANRLAISRDEGPGNLYYTAHLSVSLPVEEIQQLDRGIVVKRDYYHLDDVSAPITEAQQGDLLLVRVTIVAPHNLHYVVIDDPLPAGLEAVDQSLNTSPQSVEIPQEFTGQDAFWRGWGWWHFTHTQLRDEKAVISADILPAGTYIYTYLVRASNVGVFRTMPTIAQEFYFPEVYGREEGSLFTVTP